MGEGIDNKDKILESENSENLNPQDTKDIETINKFLKQNQANDSVEDKTLLEKESENNKSLSIAYNNLKEKIWNTINFVEEKKLSFEDSITLKASKDFADDPDKFIDDLEDSIEQEDINLDSLNYFDKVLSFIEKNSSEEYAEKFEDFKSIREKIEGKL